MGCMNYGGFATHEWPKRNVYQHRKWASIIRECKTVTAVKTTEAKCGYRHSALLNLPYFDTVRYHIIDPMHNLFLGTSKHMLNIWLKSNVLGEADLFVIQEKIASVNISKDSGWIPRSFVSNWRSFNAHEWKSWTLIYSMYALKGVLPEQDYQIWSWFVLACQKITKSYITKDDATMFHNMIMQFLRMFEKKYGSDSVTPNMHMHAHLKDCVIDYGSVYGFWLFSFEG